MNHPALSFLAPLATRSFRTSTLGLSLALVFTTSIVSGATAQRLIDDTPRATDGNTTAAQTPEQLRRVDPPSPNTSADQLELRADSLRVQKLLPDAIDYYRAAIRIRPTAQLWNKMGMSELLMFHLAAARKDFDKSIKLDHKFADAYNNRAVVYYQWRNLGRAVKDYRKAIKLRGDFATYHSNLGTAFFEGKQFDKAQAEYMRALAIDPNVFDHNPGMGVSAHLVGSKDRARYNYTIAKMFAVHGDNDHALLFLRKALEDGYKTYKDLYADEGFAKLRQDPRFTALMDNKPVALPE